MRKNISNVIEAFSRQAHHTEKSCSTDGETILSYNMVIAIRCRGGVYAIKLSESPSSTTSGQIRAIEASFPSVESVDHSTIQDKLDCNKADQRKMARHGN